MLWKYFFIVFKLKFGTQIALYKTYIFNQELIWGRKKHGKGIVCRGVFILTKYVLLTIRYKSSINYIKNDYGGYK